MATGTAKASDLEAASVGLREIVSSSPTGMLRRPSSLLVGLFVGSLALAGCNRRVGQCNELVERLNPHTEAMVRAVEGLARVETDPAALDALVGAIDLADRELAVVELDDERLAGFGVRYRKQLMDARAAADAMRKAAAEKNVAGLNAAAKQADAFLEGQAAILEELNHYCAGG